MKKYTSLCGFHLLAISALFAGATMLAAHTARADSILAEAPPAAPPTGTGQGTVLKDKVNIRARASRNAEVVAQVNKGDALEVLERKAVGDGAKSMEWLRVTLPASAKCFVLTKMIKDGAATADAVNIRCGPGASFKDIGKLAKGEQVQIVKTQGEWSEIKPTAHCTGWIAAEFVNVEAPAPAAPSPSAIENTTPPVALPVTAVPTAPSAGVSPGDSEVHVQYVIKEGVLQAVNNEPNAPSSYELRTPEVEGRSYRLAYLTTTEKNLTRYEDKPVRVYGNQSWRKSDRFPVIAIERIDMVW